VDVKDSNAGTVGVDQTLVGRNGTDSGHNTNWDFILVTDLTWTGSASSDWANPANWNPSVVPIAGDTVIIPGGTPTEPILSADVNIGNLTVAAAGTLTLNGHNLTVTSTVSNNGNIIIEGNETVNLTMDSTHGTVTYVGVGGGSSATHLLAFNGSNNVAYNNLVINDPNATPANRDVFQTNGTLTVNGNLTVQSGTLDIATNSDTATITGNLNVNGGTLTGYNGTHSGSINLTGSLNLTSGTLTPPGSAGSFNIGGDFTNSAGVGSFPTTAGQGTVTLNGATGSNQHVTGSTTFYNFNKSLSGVVTGTLTFDATAGTIQLFTNGLTLQGTPANALFIRPSVAGQEAKIGLNTSGSATLNYLDVLDSDANGSGAYTQTLVAFNSTDSSSPPTPTTDPNWEFDTLSITDPILGSTTGQTPTVIGKAPPGGTVQIKGIVGGVTVVVGTAKADSHGNFRGAVTSTLDLGANGLTPVWTAQPAFPGPTNTITVVASPTTTEVPLITSLNGNTIVNPSLVQFVGGTQPTVAGQGAANQAVTVQALDANGDLLLTAGSGTVDSSGNFSVTLSTALPASTNILSVVVSNVASALINVTLADPFGYVYNTTTNQPLQGAQVTIYDATTKQPVAGTLKSCNAAGTCCDMSGSCTDIAGNTTTGNPAANPMTTLGDGFYSFLVPNGSYYISVSEAGYNYPSIKSSVPSGRSVISGSKGENFAVGGLFSELDLPMDANASLLHITKTANKSEAMVGDIVTYTVKIQNYSALDDVKNVYLNDLIPPGFKYVKQRVLYNNGPVAEPFGERPLRFSLGSVPAATTQTLQYQLVIGAGVTTNGTYQNTATAQFSNGVVISNPAQASVKVIPDPLFDLGTVIGKVFFDWNENGIQDPPRFDAVSHETVVEKPVPNVQLVMEDGTVITTDREGKFSIPGLIPGRHLFRVDERTLPPGSYLTTDKTALVDITAGSIAKVNFGVNIDESITKNRDAVFFNEKIRLTQDRNRPVPRLNAALFNASANAAPGTEEVVLHEGALVRQAEFRIFTNYSPFIGSWRLEILDADTRKVIKSFEGSSLNITDPIYWHGQDDHDVIIDSDHKYSYILTVTDNKGNSDTTKEKPITVREIKDDVALKKETDEDKDVLKDRATRYRQWLDNQETVINLDHQLIPIQGETIHFDRQGTDVKSIHVMKGSNLFTDIPLSKQYGLTPSEVLAGGFSMADEKDNLEIILPNGDYTLDVVSANSAGNPQSSQTQPIAAPEALSSSGMPSRTVAAPSQAALERYSRDLKVGDDYMMFVALGDAQAGYNIDRGHIEPIQDTSQLPGFYKQGRAAYYLKGQILGKYLITSSLDTDRQTKALYRRLDPNTYYPVYGDSSSINYDAADTQGPLYLKVEWDKSSAILGNYAVDFHDTEFAAFSQRYYGGKLEYQSVASNPYGDARTKLVVYHAQVQQEPSHNEFLATGGSLYFLKYKNVVQGSDSITLEVRDQTTGLVVASQKLVNGADYELDNAQGRILFWLPVAMIAQTENIITSGLINGNPIYVVADYQYEVANMPIQGSQGARVAQGVGNKLVLGGTFIQDNSSGQNYTLEGTDATFHVNKDTTLKAEYAKTTSQQQGSYVSTDGGITFTSLNLSNDATGKAYGITGDSRLFDNVGVKTYYKWVGADFGASTATSQQGKESMGMTITWDMTPVTRVTASEDIQKLMAGANLAATTQVGASETDTTMIEIVHQAEKAKMTGEFQLTETKNVVNGVVSTTNQRGATFAGQAQYDLTPRIKLTLGQQVDVINKNNTATTIGATARLTDQTSMNVQEVFSAQGRALTGGLTNQLGKRIALTTNFTLTNMNTGEVDKTVSVSAEGKVTDKITVTAAAAQTASSTGTTTNSASLGAKAEIANGLTLSGTVGNGQSSGGAQAQFTKSLNLTGTTQIGNTTVTGIAQATGGLNSSVAATSTAANPLGVTSTLGTATSAAATPSASGSVGVQAVTKVNENTTTSGGITEATDLSGAKTTTFTFGNTSQLDRELQAVTANSFSFSPAGATDSSQYGLLRTVNGLKSEASFTQQSATQTGSITQSNIFGLSGDVNDKVALNAGIEKGKVQNLDTSTTNRTDITLGMGYVLKDTETATERLKNSLKLEYRVDKGTGTDSLHQYVLYDAIEGRITDNWSVNAKLDYSKTLDTTTGAVAERHQEIILGMAYRPVNFDNLNLITEYSYQEGYGGGTQQADALNTNVLSTKAQVFSAEAVYDINDKWQAVEKAALRIETEQDTGFQFNQTHTWLVIQRLNYKIDSKWTISGEYRNLVQNEAKDYKQGVLVQATREINANTELSIGWNFTSYTDDLTNLSYTAQGPFIRMTGKFYDETPEERARAKAKWLDARINQWAWSLIRQEFSKKDSQVVLELNRMFVLAKKAQKAGHLEQSHRIYKDIISAGQMMYDEASEYVRGRIDFEEQLQKLNKNAREYFKGGEYVKARKIWEKIVEDASAGGKIKSHRKNAK
jgi:uncharacterized repeat protein (TIGR01451 family)